MKIMCSGDIYPEPIDTSTCLDCALSYSGEQPCGYGYPLLKAIFATQEGDKRAKEIHVTDITGCLLKAYLDKTAPVAPYVHDMLYLFIGIAVHSALDINDQNVASEVSFEKNSLHGRADAIFEDLLLDHKTTRWLTPYKLPYGTHSDQVNIYNSVFNKSRIQIQYIDMSGPTRCKPCKVAMRMIDGVIQCPSCGNAPKSAHLGAVIYEISPQDMRGFIDKRVSELALHMSNGTEPEPEPGFLCSYCDHISCTFNQKRSLDE